MRELPRGGGVRRRMGCVEVRVVGRQRAKVELNETSYLNITKLAESMIGSTVLLILVASGRWCIAW